MAQIYTVAQRKYLTLGIIIFLCGFLLYALRNIFSAALGAFILYTLFKPLYKLFTVKFKWGKSLSSISVCFLSFVLIVMPLLLFSWMLVEKINEVRHQPTEIMLLMNKVEQLVGKYLTNTDFIEETLLNIRKWSIELISSVLSSTFDLFLIVGLMYFTLYYMFYHHKSFEETLMKYVPFSRENSIRFGKELNSIAISNIIGQGFIALVQGFLVTVGFWIFGIKDAIFWGGISTFLSFLPVVGSPLVFVPTGLILMAYNDYFAGIGIIVWGFGLVTTIDNVMRFFINKKIADTHPLITVFGVVIGLPAFGVLGLVYGPFLISFFLLLVSLYEKTYIDKSQHEKPTIY
jgi:predicted PurR-regulated permease PerM